jgi:hypothetical protein
MGRQLFTLPLFWQVFDLNLIPDLKALLVTHAYSTFFDRTLANFEALVEGRDIRIGRPVDEPSLPAVEQLMPVIERIGDIVTPLLQRLTRSNDALAADEPPQVDADGFVHVRPDPAMPAADTTNPTDRWIDEIARFIEGFRMAAQRDMAQLGKTK